MTIGGEERFELTLHAETLGVPFPASREAILHAFEQRAIEQRSENSSNPESLKFIAEARDALLEWCQG